MKACKSCEYWQEDMVYRVNKLQKQQLKRMKAEVSFDDPGRVYSEAEQTKRTDAVILLNRAIGAILEVMICMAICARYPVGAKAYHDHLCGEYKEVK